MQKKKSKEKEELLEAEKTVRQNTSDLIVEIHQVVNNKIKTLAWNSHARQVKALQVCSKLKTEYDEGIEEHVLTETDLRHINIKIENEIAHMIST